MTEEYGNPAPLSLGPHQPPDFEGVRHQFLTDFLCGAPLGAARN